MTRGQLVVLLACLTLPACRSAVPEFRFVPPPEIPIVMALMAPLRVVSASLPPRNTLGAALQGHGLSTQDVHELVSSLNGVRDFRSIRPGATYTLGFHHRDSLPNFFRLEDGALDVVEAHRDDSGEWIGHRIDIPVETRVEGIGILIEDSLYASLDRSGESPELASLLAEVFAWDIDFQRDQRQGDRFRMLVEKSYSNGEFVGYGKVLAAEYHGIVGRFRTFWYDPPDAPKSADYFLEDGRSARKLFLATPLPFTRVTSSFSMRRRHPILGYNAAHLGVDYGAPQGTPVRAMAVGVVSFAGWSGANGNLITIRHGNGLESSYAHLHRIGKGIRPGTRVDQKQSIGTVGSTGRSTGPHLHFAVKRQGRFVNPQKLEMSRLDPVPPGRRAEFIAMVRERSDLIAAIRLPDTAEKTAALSAE